MRAGICLLAMVVTGCDEAPNSYCNPPLPPTYKPNDLTFAATYERASKCTEYRARTIAPVDATIRELAEAVLDVCDGVIRAATAAYITDQLPAATQEDRDKVYHDERERRLGDVTYDIARLKALKCPVEKKPPA